ncbi:hypothetical protein SAMN06273572_1011088 [Monaibacterium marinum]|uniref:Uncharacterized protein n=1 Tax=Pontivivens marinum TaxID=1690039 RepID=A0A2C9CPQ7_9RHOB|nr:hypothetical protein [Monaibacterium marinum]SOH93232.1 hypothetical protein SAMN06273572_1011088 [Monaibacterium marinum]
MPLNVMMVVQDGRLAYEALLATASFVPTDDVRLWLMEPQPGPNWPQDPRVANPEIRAELQRHAALTPFHSTHFGAFYPHGNKMEALSALPEEQPFLFLDTDTLFLGPLPKIDASRPAASLRRTATWPKLQPDGPTRAEIWRSLYDRFGLTLTEDTNHPSEDWQRFPYYNAGWFCGPCPRQFGARFVEYATEIHANPGPALTGQSLNPWLDQIALPLVIASLGGGPRAIAGLDDTATCHWRTLPLAYARESDAVIERLTQIAQINRVKKLLKGYPPFHQMLYRGGGAQARALFADGLPDDEAVIRKRLRAAGLWVR